MRGRRARKPKPLRSPRRRKPTGEGKPIVNLHGLAWYVIQEGPEQSVLWSVEDHTDEFVPREKCVPNSWFKPWRVRLKTERVKLLRRYPLDCKEDE